MMPRVSRFGVLPRKYQYLGRAQALARIDELTGFMTSVYFREDSTVCDNIDAS